LPDPVIFWFRRDLRLADHPALTAALAQGGPVIPVFLLDDGVEALGAAPKFRLGLGVAALAGRLAAMGSRLILRRGPALHALLALLAETGARAVHWSRLYDPLSRDRDAQVKTALKAQGIAATSHPGHLLFEPWEVQTGAGGFYRVFTPYWRATAARSLADPLPAPPHLPAPATWPASDRLDDWGLDRAMNRGASVVAAHQRVGEAAALDRLHGFLAERITRYRADRDRPHLPATSGLAENLTVGEISPRTIWHAARAAEERGAPDTFRKELVWREFAWHLLYHTPHIAVANWKPDWDSFPWATEPSAAFRAWQQGRTGVPFVDAGMRQMYVTGTMHNRARMIVASYLTKHLMTHWKLGLDWFADCLTDWDPASNAMGWQWAAGSGPDAAPYFRIFNPVTQLEKFDPGHLYPRAWIAEGQRNPPDTALSWFDAIPRTWGLSAADRYPARPVVDLSEGRGRALAAYAGRGAAAAE
jgi:deoxyribodipyrimidine photo-lyase